MKTPEKNFTVTISKGTDRHMKKSPIEAARAEVARLNTKINGDAEARRKFVEENFSPAER